MPDTRAVILFDGYCNLCNGSVRFIIANDPDAHFAFAASQSAAGFAALRAAGHPAAPDGIVLIDRHGLSERSEAALRIASRLRAPWSALGLLRAVPVHIRDPLYAWIARNRYRWFGRRSTCSVPAPGQRERFL